MSKRTRTKQKDRPLFNRFGYFYESARIKAKAKELTC